MGGKDFRCGLTTEGLSRHSPTLATATTTGDAIVSEIRTKVIDIIADRLSRDKATITDGSDLVADLGADSLDVAEVTMDLEDAFGVKIEEEKAQSLKTLGDIVKAIEEKVAK